MDTNEIQKAIRGLMTTSWPKSRVRYARPARKRAKLRTEDIKPGMTPAERASVQREINRVLAGL